MGSGWLLWEVVLFAVLFAALAYAVVTRTSGQSSANAEADMALETLRERYARGELSDEEFEERRQRLERDKNQR